MSTNRIKLPTTVITRARAEEILGEVAALKLEERAQKNALDSEITNARQSYEEPLTALAKAIEEKTTLLESWAAANPGEFPRGRKSIELIHGVIGYRTGMPKLKTLGKWTWDRVLAACEALGLSELIRVKAEVNRDAIIGAASTGDLTGAQLKSIGVQVVQDEAFFVEPRLAEQPARTVVETAA